MLWLASHWPDLPECGSSRASAVAGDRVAEPAGQRFDYSQGIGHRENLLIDDKGASVAVDLKDDPWGASAAQAAQNNG